MIDDIHNALLDLRREIADALECVERAGTIASNLAADDETGKPVWSDMGRLADQLAAVSNQLRSITPDPIKAAINDAEKYLDHLSDLADGQRY